MRWACEPTARRDADRAPSGNNTACTPFSTDRELHRASRGEWIQTPRALPPCSRFGSRVDA